jgi:hypothetical protein
MTREATKLGTKAMTTISDTISDRLTAAKEAMLALINDPGFRAIKEDYCNSVDINVFDGWAALNELQWYLREPDADVEVKND